jgi:hypothetical protein
MTCAHKSSMQQEGHDNMTRPRASSTNLHAMDFDDKASAHAIERTLQAKGRETRENVMQMNITMLSTCETATQMPAATTTSHQHTPLHPCPFPTARLPQAPSIHSAAGQTAGTLHNANKTQCMHGFGCSMSHSTDTHIPDMGDMRTHTQRSNAGSEAIQTGSTGHMLSSA